MGLPIASLLLHRHATVTVAHSRTKPDLLKDLCRRADVVVVAAGVPGLVKPDWVKRGTIVVNVGTTFNELNEVLLTDTEEAVQRMAGVMVTPTPRCEWSCWWWVATAAAAPLWWYYWCCCWLLLAWANPPLPVCVWSCAMGWCSRRLSNGALTPSGVGPLTLPFVLHSTLVNAV